VSSTLADRTQAPPRIVAAGPDGGPRRGSRVPWLIYALVAAAGAVVLLLSSFSWSLPSWLNDGQGREGVLNGSATFDLTGWSASADVRTVTLTPVGIGRGPGETRTAIDIQGPPVNGRWAMALADLDRPAGLFRAGRTYRMQAYVRDLNASRRTIGMLLANDNHVHQPTTKSSYDRFTDNAWHLLTRTFIADGPGSADTRLYFALPPRGELHWQITGASVREIPKVKPPKVSDGPATTVSFAGPAGTAPDRQVWNYELGGHGWGNDELQTYTSSTANARLDGAGNLLITAQRESATGSDGIKRAYTSARLTTAGKLAIQPGSYVEAAIRAPVGRGVWPAFWMLGGDIATVGWPAAGELDVLEASGSRPTVARSRMHMSTTIDPGTDLPYPQTEDRGAVDLARPLDVASHLYAVYFDGTMVRFYIDRRERLAYDVEDATASGRTWPFGGPQYLILNVAINSNAAGTAFPQTMTVGHISVWRGGTPF
jgi:hypothetical protein